MGKVDDVNDFKTFGPSQPKKEDPFLKAVTQLTKTLGCHGVKGDISSPKESLNARDIKNLQVLNETLHALVMAHTLEHKRSKKPKKSKS